MNYHHLVLLCCAFISIFCTRIAYSDEKVHIHTAHKENPTIVHFAAGKTIELTCNASENGTISWEKNGIPVADVKELKDRFNVTNSGTTFIVKDLKESDDGNYTCVLNGTHKDVVVLQAIGVWGMRLSKNTNVVEGEKLTLKCEIRGDLELTWYYKNTSLENANETQITHDDERIKLVSYYNEDTKLNVTDGELKIEEIQMADRGDYTCLGVSDGGGTFKMTSTVRIKDKYAALWPFLGICAEVFVLCAIIFIYEKKRNKTELEESDTDQSPDQKNTPDHGKESNLRHRQ